MAKLGEDGTLDIPVPGQPGKGEEEMPIDGSEQYLSFEMSALAQTGRIAQNNFVTVTKIVDYDYLEGKHMVSLTEALGVREIASKTVPAGPNTIPTT